MADLAVEAGEWWGRWTMLHARNGGRLAFAPDTTTTIGGGNSEQPATRKNLTWSAERRSVPTPPVFFDFDGDGEPEAIVIVETTMTTESGRSFTVRRGRVWTARATGIELFAAAQAIAVDDVRDVDQDGRPDLITRGPYAGFATVTCGSEEPYPVSGPSLLVHSLPGGAFSWSDAIATEFAHAQCESPPKPVLVVNDTGPSKGFVEFAPSARNVACARLWGATEGLLTSEIAKRCSRKAPSSCPRCDDATMLTNWAKVPPPVALSLSNR